MAGNAHRNRHKLRVQPCASDCKYCSIRPKFGKYSNKNGNRHNPASKRCGKRGKKN